LPGQIELLAPRALRLGDLRGEGGDLLLQRTARGPLVSRGGCLLATGGQVGQELREAGCRLVDDYGEVVSLSAQACRLLLVGCGALKLLRWPPPFA
jgi:hypothetical protein